GRDAQDERERGHQDRTQPLPAGLEGRLPNQAPLGGQPLGQPAEGAAGLCPSSPIGLLFWAYSRIATIKPICTYTSLGMPRSHTPSSAPSVPNGTPSSTANGIDQLSYCAASTRNTMMSPRANTRLPWPPDARS